MISSAAVVWEKKLRLEPNSNLAPLYLLIFHGTVFVSQEEYVKEGIQWKNIEFIDNTGCLNLFSKRPTGLLCLLDEECKSVINFYK